MKQKWLTCFDGSRFHPNNLYIWLVAWVLTGPFIFKYCMRLSCFSPYLWSGAQLNSDQCEGPGGIYHDPLRSSWSDQPGASTQFKYRRKPLDTFSLLHKLAIWLMIAKQTGFTLQWFIYLVIISSINSVQFFTSKFRDFQVWRGWEKSFIAPKASVPKVEV